MTAVESGITREKRAFQETIKSARLGVAEAQYEVGLMYANGVGVTRNIGQAVHWVQQSAQRGYVNAQYLLATRYESGVGVEQSTQFAALWYGRAAEQAHSKAAFRLGKLYARAHVEQAAVLYRQAADAGLADAQHALALCYETGLGVPQDPQWAQHWYGAAAQQGLAAAQFALGERFRLGSPTVNPEPALALRWYRQAAAQYHLGARVTIARMEQEAAGDASMPVRGRGRNRRGPQAAERRRDEAGWIQAAETGDAEARYQLAQMYAHGYGVEADPQKAQEWYRAAAQQNHLAAQLALALLLERSADSESIHWYQRAAAQGDAQAQFALGRIYCAGEVVAQDYQRGISWYHKAAEQDHALALVTLGNLFNAGMQHVAASCYERAARLGSAQAQYQWGQQLARGEGVVCHPGQAFLWHEKAALQGHAGAQCALGVAYLGGVGVHKNAALALQWLQRAAEQGNAQAQWNLGAMYAAGNDALERDLVQAFTWCQRAADQGYVAAQSNLGVLYALSGKATLAMQWWSKAAEQGDPEAQYNLGLVYLKGEHVPRNPARGFALLLAAAQANVIPAQSRLGILYASGDGVAEDPIEACKWFALASAHGDAAANANLARSETLYSAAQIAEGRRRASVLLSN